MDRIIEIKVGGNHIAKDSKTAGVRGEANAAQLRITFDESWESYGKTVTFWDAKGANPVERILTTDLEESAGVYLVPIPAEPMAEAGMMTFVIDGYTDGKRQRSMSDKLEVKDAPIADNAGKPADPTPTQAEQLQTQIDGIIIDIRGVADAKQYVVVQKKIIETHAKTSQTNAVNANASAKEAEESMLEAQASASEAKESEEKAKEYRDSAREISGGQFVTLSELLTKTARSLKVWSVQYVGKGDPEQRPRVIFDRVPVPLNSKPRMLVVYSTDTNKDEALLAFYDTPSGDTAKGLNIALRLRHAVDFDVLLTDSGSVVSTDLIYLQQSPDGWEITGNALYLNCYNAEYHAVLFYEEG